MTARKNPASRARRKPRPRPRVRVRAGRGHEGLSPRVIARSLAQRPNLPPHQSSEHQVEIGGKIRLACTSGSRMGTHHEQATSGERGEPPAHEFPEPSLYPVANHRRANRTADNKPTFGLASSGTRPAAVSSRCPERVAPPARRPERITRLNSSGLLIRDCCGSTTPPASRGQPAAPGRVSDGELLAALAAARGKDGAASTGTHTLTEAVDLGPSAVVRLERALAHWNSRSVRKLRCLMKGGHAMRRAARLTPG